jgi:DNA-binding FadR family transcriptional regulator
MSDKNLLSDLAAHLYASSAADSGRTPSERELAEHFGVSRGQIRETLAVLEAMRIVERRAKSGIFLTTRFASVDAMALFARAGLPLDPIQIYETVELRKIHEIKAAELASARATQANFDRLAEILAQSERRIAADQPLGEEDRDFHLEIVRATQNTVFYNVCSVYYAMGIRRLPIYFSDPSRCRQSHAEHIQIFEALRRRDGNLAQALMGAHLQGAEGYWKGLISGRQAGESPLPAGAD